MPPPERVVVLAEDSGAPRVQPHSLDYHAAEEAKHQCIGSERDAEREPAFRRDHDLALHSTWWILIVPA